MVGGCDCVGVVYVVVFGVGVCGVGWVLGGGLLCCDDGGCVSV